MGAGQRAARLGLDFGRELLVLDLLVAFESDAADHGVFDHDDDQAAARLVDLTSWNRPVSISAFRPSSMWACPEAAAGARLEIGADGLGFDAAVALDRNRRRGLGAQPATTQT